MRTTRFQKIQIGMITVMIVLLLVLLSMLGIRKNVAVWSAREDDSFITVQNVVCDQIEDTDSPGGKSSEFSFMLDNTLVHDTNLIFYASHQMLDVWIGEEYVYSLKPSGQLSFIKTVGSKWVRIPVYRENAGETVRVVMTPVYEKHLETDTIFYLGSPLAVYRSQLAQTLPGLVLSVVNILVGLLLLIIAVYCIYIKQGNGEVMALSMLAITMGLWQFAHNDFSPFMAENKTIFLYYVSVLMMLVCMIPLVWSAGAESGKNKKTILSYYIMGVAGMAVIQIILQMLGVLDLREMFPLTHGSIILGALLLIGKSIWNRAKKEQDKDINKKSGSAWILGAGALGDLFFYYVRGTSSGLIMILSAILCFVLLEGARFMSSYMEQSRIMAEKEKQLIQSRAAAMMSQIRSHFVFNVLNAVSGMCKYDPEKADETLVRFARYLRSNIDIMENDRMVPFVTELQRLEDDVVLEQVRFGDGLEFVTDIEVTDFMIPPMILQPIVENAIKHGLARKKSGGSILLSTWEEDGRILISVDDDGIGFDMQELEKEKSVGLKKIRFRLQHMAQGTVDIKSKPGNGTKVIVSIPRKEEALCE